MKTFIYPPFLRWSYMTQRPHQLMREFARQDSRAIFHSGENEVMEAPGVKLIAPNLYICNRDVTPLMHIRIDDSPVLWISYPPYVELIGKYYGEQMVVFDCVDDAVGDFAHWGTGLQELLTKADLVLTASQPLFEKYRKSHKNTFLCRNGVDYEHFVKPHVLPGALQNIKRPIIGYHGALAPWLDWPLIEEVANLNPDFSFVFVGPPYEMSDSPQNNNIHYLGYKSYEELPAYIQGFDVGLIPFSITEMTVHSNPIKMYEYLACGIPVVSTPLPESEYCEPVMIAHSANEFSLLLARLVKENNSVDKDFRKSFAKENSWQVRAQYANSLVNNFLKNKD